MSRNYFDGKDAYLIYGVESSYGTGTPAAANAAEKLQNVSYTFTQNLLISQGVGEGANATSATYGNFDVSGNITTKPTEDGLKLLQFGSGTISGAGTSGSPYKLIEGDNVGYSGTFIRTATLEIGGKGVSNNKRYTIPGSSFNSWTFSGNQGEELQLSIPFVGQTVSGTTTLTGYTSGTVKTITFTSGSVSWNNEELGVTNFSVTSNHPSNYPREVFNRFGKQPTKGVRRYNWTLTLNKHFDDTAGVISATELIDEFFGDTDAPASSGIPTGREMSIDINEGSTSGNRAVTLQLSNSFLNDWAENPSLEGGIVSVTVNGFSFSGKSVSGEKVPLTWHTV